jgi:hypothetical protein
MRLLNCSRSLSGFRFTPEEYYDKTMSIFSAWRFYFEGMIVVIVWFWQMMVSCVYHDHDYHVCVGFIACFMIRRRMMMMLRDKYERRQSVKKERIRRGIYKRDFVLIL